MILATVGSIVFARQVIQVSFISYIEANIYLFIYLFEVAKMVSYECIECREFCLLLICDEKFLQIVIFFNLYLEQCRL